MPLIEFTDKGLYCARGLFYIDPWRPVDKAVITHAHSDHARPGSGGYLCHRLTVPLLELRLAPPPGSVMGVEWGETVVMNGVKVSLHPAGHVIGSSQVRVEYQGEVWVVSGDYKTEDDGISGAFEPIRCHVFITESTFGLPIYNWKPQPEIFRAVSWWLGLRQRIRHPFIAYSLGKAQRLLLGLAPPCRRSLLHGAIWMCRRWWVLVSPLPLYSGLHRMPREWYKGKVVIAPSSAEGSPWIRRFNPYAIGICSGWMQVRGNVRRRNADAGFAMSDHADWKGLLGAIEATGAEKVFVTHGFQATLARYLNERGIEAAEVKTEYGEDEEAADDGTA